MKLTKKRIAIGATVGLAATALFLAYKTGFFKRFNVGTGAIVRAAEPRQVSVEKAKLGGVHSISDSSFGAKERDWKAAIF